MSSFTSSNPLFQLAVTAAATELPSSLSYAQKGEIYGLYKVATVSATPTTARPGFFDQVGRGKWDAWTAAGADGAKSAEQGQTEYIALVEQLSGKKLSLPEAPASSSSSAATESSAPPSTTQDKLNDVVASLGTAKFEAPTVSVSEIIARMSAKDDTLVLMDIRSKEETDISTIAGAITRAEFDADPSKYAGKEVVAFCTVGYCSGAVACSLRRSGLTNVKNMGDGALLGYTLAMTAGGDSMPLVKSDGSKTNEVHTFMPDLLGLAGEGMAGFSFKDPSAVLTNFNETFVKGELGL